VGGFEVKKYFQPPNPPDARHRTYHWASTPHVVDIEHLFWFIANLRSDNCEK